jgi:hypothetical protein
MTRTDLLAHAANARVARWSAIHNDMLVWDMHHPEQPYMISQYKAVQDNLLNEATFLQALAGSVE